MSAWKQFLASDIIVTPFTVNKGFIFPSSQFATGSDGQLVGIDRFVGTNVNWFTSQSTTGDLNIEYQALVYNSIKQLYYSNNLSSSLVDSGSLPVLVPGAGPSGSGDVLIGNAEGPLYDNFLQSTLNPNRFFPTGSGDNIVVISIPSKIFGDYIQPGSVILQSGSVTLVDDGEGILFQQNTTASCGNVIYTHGMIIITTSSRGINGYGGSYYGTSVYGDPVLDFDITTFASTPITCSFSSSYTIYETQYKCTIRESEFNSTLNPSAQTSGSTYNVNGSTFYQPGGGELYSSLTGSYFSPYITKVGLYDNNQNLLAVGKLSQPLPSSNTTDLTILVNIDK
jgi:hypothetical protein